MEFRRRRAGIAADRGDGIPPDRRSGLDERAGWRVRIDDRHSAINAKEQISWQYYVASAPEVIDARKINDEHWQDAVPAPAAAARTLIVDPFPPQLFVGARRKSRAQLARRR